MRQNVSMLKITTFALLLLFFSLAAYSASNEDLQQRLAQDFASTCLVDQFSGNVLIAIDDKIIFQKSCGLANRDFNVPNNLQTKFNLGSVGKLFTSVAIAQLIEARKLTLDTKANEFIPEWLSHQEDNKITIKQLLTHTSGLGNFMDDKRWQLGADSGLYINVKDYKALINDDNRLFIPGSSQSYSNNGYVVLGAVIESISHLSYDQFIQKNIFDKAGMKNTGIWTLDDLVPNRAQGYFYTCVGSECKWKNNNFETPFSGTPAGGAYSTVEDLFKFARALQSEKLLNNEMTKKILSTEIQTVPDTIKTKIYKFGEIEVPENITQYGFAGAWNAFGFAVWKNPDLVGHTGGTKGASALLAMSPDGKYTIIILSNIDGAGPILLYRKIRSALGMPPEIVNY